MTYRTDPQTGEQFIPKRSNQVFANRQNQIKFNNAKARTKRMAKNPIDKPLDKNRNILMRIMSDQEEASVSRDYLLGAGFDFQFFNRSYMDGDTIYQCVYEYAITKEANGVFTIIKLEE